jgi:uncharacterized membrane protein
MERLSVLLFSCFLHFGASACVTCNKPLQREIYDSTFYPNLATMLSAFFVLALLVFILARLTNRRYSMWIVREPGIVILHPGPLTTAATVLGIGLGGFTDGILFHQLLQWHEMVSNKVPVSDLMGKSVNMFWDGLFHCFCLIVVIIGVILMWRLLWRNDIDRSGKLLAGGLLLGWGLFNCIEGIIDHHLLKLHNVLEFTADHDFWNFGLLAVSVLLILVGWLLTRSGKRKTAR